MLKLSTQLARYRGTLHFAAAAFALLSLFRLALIALHFTRVDPALIPELLLTGLRIDAIGIGYLCAPAVLLSAIAPHRANGTMNTLLLGYFVLGLVLLAGMEAIGIGFLREYDHRPDALFWEYLAWPDEVVPMLWRGFKMEMTVTVFTLVIAARAAWAITKPGALNWPTISLPWRILSFAIAAVALVSMIRGFDHRPANISTALFSNNRLANELALNSAYTAAYALAARQHEQANAALYDTIPFDEAIARIRADSGRPATAWISDELPTVHVVAPHTALNRPHNLVILLEESLGAQFVGALGSTLMNGAGLTPNLDRLAQDGLWFTQMYATGTRTVRGMEAVVAGYPPSAARSVVKRGKSRRDFFTIATALGEQGYHNLFLYGGAPNFDDMGSFLLGNGFDELITQEQFADADFTGTWGVSDGDLVRKAHATFSAQPVDRPFFALMLSTSNHTPWEFPDEAFAPGDRQHDQDHAIRYADQAIGEFFTLARQADYYDNTVFLVIADHDARVHGADQVPIQHFHIPALLIAPGLKPRQYDQIASQIDLIPTLLPLLGTSFRSAAPGRDLLAPDAPEPGRALMQYGLNFALLSGNQAVLVQPHQPPSHARYGEGRLIPTAKDPELERNALAWLSLSDALYGQGRYKLP